MRIISGKWKGHRLVPFKSNHIRPTTDFVKENIFNSIGPAIEDALVLDLFAGTGSLGFESLSRGAHSVIAVDKGKDSREVVRKNIQKLGIKESYDYRFQDVFRFLKNYDGAPFDFIFVDPPFKMKWAKECLLGISKSSCFGVDTRIFVECVKGEEIIREASRIILVREKNYGDKTLCVYEVNEEGL